MIRRNEDESGKATTEKNSNREYELVHLTEVPESLSAAEFLDHAASSFARCDREELKDKWRSTAKLKDILRSASAAVVQTIDEIPFVGRVLYELHPKPRRLNRSQLRRQMGRMGRSTEHFSRTIQRHERLSTVHKENGRYSLVSENEKKIAASKRRRRFKSTRKVTCLEGAQGMLELFWRGATTELAKRSHMPNYTKVRIGFPQAAKPKVPDLRLLPEDANPVSRLRHRARE